MRPPQVSAVGVLEVPAGYTRTSRRSGWLRGAAAVLLAVFFTVAVATAVSSLGSYCLTSNAGSPFPPP